jgi:hypothetical protein
MRYQTFISYSHADQEWYKRLLVHLRPYARQNEQMVPWSDQQLRAGTQWRQEIAAAIARSQAAILLVSPDFLASDFVANHELPPLLSAAEKEGLTVLWVPVSFSAYEETAITAYQAAFEPAHPLTSLSIAERDEALVRVGRQFKAATWALSLKLSEPALTHGIRSGHKLTLRGQVNFRPRGTAAHLHGGNVRAALVHEGVQIVPFVLSGASDWWPQRKPVLEDDGRFAGEVYVGDAAGHSSGKDFLVVVCAVAQGSVVWNAPVAELPAARIESSRITVTRE